MATSKAFQVEDGLHYGAGPMVGLLTAKGDLSRTRVEECGIIPTPKH